MWAIGTLNGLTTLATETTLLLVYLHIECLDSLRWWWYQLGKSYADKGTGNDVINDRIAAKRAAAVVWMLTKKYNIPSERITEECKGARVQPFAENADNRVTIMIAK